MQHHWYRHIVGLLLPLVLLAACRPEHILSSKEMEDVLVDLHLTDGILREAGFTSFDEQRSRAYYASVLAKHGITQADFDSSLVYYTHHPVRFEKIYPKVTRRLQQEVDKVNLQYEQQYREAERYIPTLEEVKQLLLYGLQPDFQVHAEPYPDYIILPIEPIAHPSHSKIELPSLNTWDD